MKEFLKKERYKRIMISAIVFFTLILLNYSNVFAENTVTYVALPVKEVKRAYSNWCWAAGCESILYYCSRYLGYGREATQWDIVKYIYGSYVNMGATRSEIQIVLSYYGVGSSVMVPISGWVITYGQICQQVINYRSPIGMIVPGHFAVLCGVWQYYDVNGYLQNYTIVMDPAKGKLIYIPDEELRNDNGYWDLREALRIYKL